MVRAVHLTKQASVVAALYAAMAVISSAQTLTTLASFNYSEGAYPYAALVQATNGDFYGTTFQGGMYGRGAIYKITPGGELTTLYSFCAEDGCPDGFQPSAGLVQAKSGDFYGTTSSGGNLNCDPGFGCGTIFKMTPDGVLTTLYTFCAQSNCTDGAMPNGGLVQAADGNFYGTTQYGGTNQSPFGSGFFSTAGTIFTITPDGTLQTVYNFCAQAGCTDGGNPYGGLVQARNGELYGTTELGGDHGGFGTIFKISSNGTFTTFYSFCAQSGCADGEYPYATLVQGTDGDLYGTTPYGGTVGLGTAFKITLSGTLTTLYGFCAKSGCSDGEIPYAGLVQATDGNIYGATFGGGGTACGNSLGCGTVFKIARDGALTTLYDFCSQSGCTDGYYPEGGLLQATNGDLYGTTTGQGAIQSYGTVFKLSLGLGPFVEPQTSSGKVGAIVKILGSDLTGASSVTFNGTAAEFTVTAASLITATVPAGATTGDIQVVTPRGTLSSNVPFRVRP